MEQLEPYRSTSASMMGVKTRLSICFSWGLGSSFNKGVVWGHQTVLLGPGFLKRRLALHMSPQCIHASRFRAGLPCNLCRNRALAWDFL
eukprot:9350322-Pyramimonas_sp.AAC.1